MMRWPGVAALVLLATLVRPDRYALPGIAGAGQVAPPFVQAASSPAPGARQAPRLTLAIDPAVDGLRVVATLREPRGRPMAGQEVSFARRTAFGWVALATVTTDATGTAAMTIPETRKTLQLRADVEGTEALGPATATARWQAAAAPVQPERPGAGALRVFTDQAELISPNPPPLLLLFLGLILGGVWGTYVYVLYELIRGGRPTSRPPTRSRTA